jgi:hypothetical protein
MTHKIYPPDDEVILRIYFYTLKKSGSRDYALTDTMDVFGISDDYILKLVKDREIIQTYFSSLKESGNFGQALAHTERLHNITSENLRKLLKGKDCEYCGDEWTSEHRCYGTEAEAAESRRNEHQY